MQSDKIYIDVPLLKKYMNKCGWNIEKLSHELKISHKKAKELLENRGAESLTYGKINNIVRGLEINREDTIKIFFS